MSTHVFRLVVIRFCFDYSGFTHFKCMLALTLFVTYVICDMIPLLHDITRLLHMLYVVLLVLHGISGRAFAAI